MSEKKGDEKHSFITEARRAQIVNAAVTTLNEVGYVNASLAQIARHAGVSTALISYHFHDKQDLMNQTLMTLLSMTNDYVLERVRAASTTREKLHAYIAASLAYQGTRPEHNTALIEIVFHARTPENVPYYKLGDNEEEPLLFELQEILRAGQASGEFCSFNVRAMASAIRGAIAEQIDPDLAAKVDLETYSAELVKLFDRAIVKDTGSEAVSP